MLSIEEQEKLILKHLPWHEVYKFRCIVQYATCQYNKLFEKMAAVISEENYQPPSDHRPGSPPGFREVKGSHNH